MKRLTLVAASVLALAGAGAALLWSWPVGKPPSAALASFEGNVDRGAYLARMAGCIACHTNTEKGGAPLAGGVTLETAFGVFRSPNLTTDPEHGIGNWTMEQFSVAVRQGVSPEGQPYYPAFPYPFYAKFSDQDIADLWAAFQTVPPVPDAVAGNDLGFPYNLRVGLKIWRGAFLDVSGFTPDPDRSDEWNRGKYIVTGPAHCGACHTPRNFAGARELDKFLTGGSGLPGGGSSPPITPEALKAEGWTPEDLAYALKTGILPDGDVFGGSMAEVVRDGTAFLSKDDLAAIATYLLDQK